MKKLLPNFIPVLIFLAAANPLLPSDAFGQGAIPDKRTSASVIYEAIAATNAPLWLIEDARLFENTGWTPNSSMRAAQYRSRLW